MGDDVQNFKSFKLTTEILNPEYLGGKHDAIEELYGCGYLAIISTAEDATVTIAHGENHSTRTVQCFVDAMDVMGHLPRLLVETIAKLMLKGVGGEAVMKITRTAVTAMCRAMAKEE